MIARLPNKNQKSVTVIQRVLNIGDYSRVIVIDDLFEGRGCVWSKYIPLQMREDDVMFYAFHIPPFMEHATSTFLIRDSLLPTQIMRRCIRLRERDTQLWKLNISKPSAFQIQSNWKMIASGDRANNEDDRTPSPMIENNHSLIFGRWSGKKS